MARIRIFRKTIEVSPGAVPKQRHGANDSLGPTKLPTNEFERDAYLMSDPELAARWEFHREQESRRANTAEDATHVRIRVTAFCFVVLLVAGIAVTVFLFPATIWPGAVAVLGSMAAAFGTILAASARRSKAK